MKDEGKAREFLDRISKGMTASVPDQSLFHRFRDINPYDTKTLSLDIPHEVLRQSVGGYLRDGGYVEIVSARARVQSFFLPVAKACMACLIPVDASMSTCPNCSLPIELAHCVNGKLTLMEETEIPSVVFLDSSE